MVDNNQLVEIAYLNTDLELIKDLRNLINKKYSKIFHSVIVHGSIATNEVIPYSDFDGLLIVKDSWINSKELTNFKIESIKYIYEFDPLQHHGWFQIQESDLLNYPENYLPVNTLRHSKLIFPESKKINLEIEIKDKVDYNSFLLKMLNQFEKRELEKWRPRNSYELKSFLSQIMLLPCLYYSLLNNRGIFKKESFDAVKEHFDETEWLPIVVSSEIRSNWDYEISSFQKKILKVPNRYFRKIVTRLFSPKISIDFQKQLNDKFYKNLNLLIEKIKKDIV